MDKKLDILDKVKEYLGNKTTQILDNQYKEFLKLNDIRRAFGISEKVLNNSFNFTSKEFNDLINNLITKIIYSNMHVELERNGEKNALIILIVFYAHL
ncbi:TPA: hypothetical protein ACPXHO_001908 [Streptococcus pneumoniae]